MVLLSGNNQDGYWNYINPQNSSGLTINYSIWVNDTNDNSDSTTAYQYLIGDNELPNIIGVSQDPPSPGNLDTVNITIHISDNVGVDTVLINTNYSGSFQDYQMVLLSGNNQDGYWNYINPQNSSGLRINYSIWVNDTSNNPNSTITYQYFIVDNEYPNIILILQEPIAPGNLDTVNITVNITENIGVHTVLINTNYTGSFQDYQMDFLSGTSQDGYWNYTIPQGTVGITINYSIWVNDTNDNSVNSSDFQYNIIDNEPPSILNVTIDISSPKVGDEINITVHITDNVEISQVQLYTDLTGTLKFFQMALISGNISDGYWNISINIPNNASGRTISYSIWVTDTNGQNNNSGIYQFTVPAGEEPFMIFPPPGENNTIIIIIIIGSVAAGAIIATTIIAKKRAPKSELIRDKDVKISYEHLKSKIISPISIIPEKIYERVQNLKFLSKQEKELLLKDLALLDDKQIEEWLIRLKELEE